MTTGGGGLKYNSENNSCGMLSHNIPFFLLYRTHGEPHMSPYNRNGRVFSGQGKYTRTSTLMLNTGGNFSCTKFRFFCDHLSNMIHVMHHNHLMSKPVTFERTVLSIQKSVTFRYFILPSQYIWVFHSIVIIENDYFGQNTK